MNELHLAIGGGQEIRDNSAEFCIPQTEYEFVRFQKAKFKPVTFCFPSGLSRQGKGDQPGPNTFQFFPLIQETLTEGLQNTGETGQGAQMDVSNHLEESQ